MKIQLTNRLLYGLLYLVSLLPLWALYGISDCMCFFVYRVIGYRKAVVLSNLGIAFPEKPLAERKAIAKQFYSNFTDSMLESIKLISAGPGLIDRMFVVDPNAFDVFSGTDKNIQIHALHNFNWEIVNQGVSREMSVPFLAVYQPIINPFFESLFKKIRSRFGTILIPANDFKNNFLPHQDQQYVIALVADQNPGNPAKAWWVNFFGKPAPFVTGPEKAARLRNTVVFFGNFYKIRRGLYTFVVEKITEDPSSMQPGELTLRYIKYIEDKIRERPDNYLWSHRRWKHPFKPAYAALALEQLNLGEH
jgi:KDO2-lipid IV(A) lauroyltransferase